MLTETTLARAGIDAIALKPVEHDLERALNLDVETVVIDYEGRSWFPDREALTRLADRYELFVTTPVRADGFDPLGDDSCVEALPHEANRVLVAGSSAYLTDDEAQRAIAPRLKAAREAAPDAWVGTEAVERVALAVGGTQYELLSRRTESAVAALRTAGFDDEIVVYAPTVLSGDTDEILDAVGGYVSRRGPVGRVLPDDAPTDSNATGRSRELLVRAANEYALIGDVRAIRKRVDALRRVGVGRVVAYPGAGLSTFE